VVGPNGAVEAGVVPKGLKPSDLQSAYQIDPNIAGSPTVAIIDAYGYAALEQDLAMYRTQYGLPPCTQANGCLKIVNSDGATSPLPPDPPMTDDWTIETALDVDMVSAACPKCKILVVQASDSADLLLANSAAADLHATTVSNSWGMDELPGADALEYFFHHDGLAVFASAGDKGYDGGAALPHYPSTSAYVIGVGGTSLKPSSGGRGWTETAWAKGGSSCSKVIPKPSFQTTSACAFRASADISAVGDPATGVSVYASHAGGWIIAGGTSASAPLVAAIFAATNHGDATPAQVAKSADALFDVTSGSNGTCGNVLCNAGPGWDGPTGYGSPNAMMLTASGLGVAITSPADGAHVMPGFAVDATVTGTATEVALEIDGAPVGMASAAPYSFMAPTSLAPGDHLVAVTASDGTRTAVSSIHVVLDDQQTTGGGEHGAGGGCVAAPGADLALVALVLFGLALRSVRRRPAFE
jgi:subtilase family serine protease